MNIRVDHPASAAGFSEGRRSGRGRGVGVKRVARSVSFGMALVPVSNSSTFVSREIIAGCAFTMRFLRVLARANAGDNSVR